MMPVVSLIQALSRLDPSALSLRNDADDLEVVAHGVSLDDPTLPAGASAALDALRAVLDEALSTGCAHVELAAQDERCSSARWRRSLASPPTVTEIERFAREPAVRVRLREAFGLGVLGDAVLRRTPERDALLRAMVAPRVPVRDLTPPVPPLGPAELARVRPPLASAALASARPPLRGGLELMPPGAAPTLVRCIEGYAWQEEPLWSEQAHRPPVRIWLDARWPSDFDASPPLRAMPLTAEWLALSDDARARFEVLLSTCSSSYSGLAESHDWRAMRQALQELVATAVMRSGRLSLQSAPRALGSGAFRGGAPHDAGDAWLPGADDVRPLLGVYLFEQQGFAYREKAVCFNHITLAALAEVAATTTDPLRYVDQKTEDDGDRATKTIRAHLSSPAVKALMTTLQARADASQSEYETAVEGWRGGATLVATLPRVPQRERLAGAQVILAVAPEAGQRPIEVTVERAGTASAPRAYGPPLATDVSGLEAWRILVRVGDDAAAVTDAEAVVLALRHAALQLNQDNSILGAVAGEADPAFRRQLISHLAGVAFALDPAGALELIGGNGLPGDDVRERAWVRPRPGSALASLFRDDGRVWTMRLLRRASEGGRASADELFRVALATLRAEGAVVSDAVDADASWAVLLSPERGARVVSLREWHFDGWAVARDDGPAEAARWKHHLAQQFGLQSVKEVSPRYGTCNLSSDVLWQHWLSLKAVSRQASAALVEEALAKVEAEPFVCVLDASNRARMTTLSALAQAGGKARGWWWRELVPGERWREEEGVFLHEGALTAAVLRELDQRLGVALTKGAVEAAAAGTGPTQWRIGLDNVRAMLALAASPGLDRFSGELREALRGWLCEQRATVEEMREAARAAKIWPTTEGTYVSAADYPPGEAPSAEYRGAQHSARCSGRAPCIVVKVSEEYYYDERVDPSTGAEELQHRVRLHNAPEIALLNDLFAPKKSLGGAVLDVGR